MTTLATRIPLLQNGDRLTRPEFERRYDAMPHLKKAELINGVVYMPAAAIRFEQHGAPHFDLIGWMSLYRTATPGIRGGDNSSLRLDLLNEPQPDAFLMVMKEFGGQARIDKEGYVTFGPELIGEVTASTASYDLHDKLEVYQRHRVQEYIVWRVVDEEIDWFHLQGKRYVPLVPKGGVFRSQVLPGLWLHSRALIEGDMLRVARVARKGLASAEHKSFVEQLRSIENRNVRKKKK
ncbi:MAG TPA: Uma2 family endonuclease [Gemmataceae bacterium]|nr:Uma2 family endonuclease [Gemmataceae bacterium]